MKTNLTRRDFLKALAGGCAAGPAMHKIAAAELKASGTIIDTHTHFYDPLRPQGVPWPPQNDKLLYRTVLPKDYRALPKPQPVTGTVVVEASSWVEDNQWILDLASADPFIVGFVGNLPIGTERFRGHLDRFAANRLFRGLRVGGSRLKEGLGQNGFMADLKRLAEKGLSLDLLGGPDLLPVTARLAKEIPDLRLVIDHVANVKIDGKAPDPAWKEGMQTAAKQKNVYCKVSGLVEGTGRSDGTAPREWEFYRPILDTVWNAFGEDRLIYGSNWPVSERFASCATVQSIVTDYFKEKGDEAVQKYFWKNAREAYRWVRRQWRVIESTPNGAN